MFNKFNEKLSKGKTQGFSLVELMVAVGIITVLASLAVPRFQVFMAKSKQAEAKANLNHIYVLQNAWYAENNAYQGMRPIGANGDCGSVTLGFRLDGCVNNNANDKNRIRYTYRVGNVTANAFTAFAVSGTGANNLVVAGCGTPDEWQINENKRLRQQRNSITACL